MLNYKRKPQIKPYTLKIAKAEPEPGETIPDDYIDITLNDIIQSSIRSEQSGKPMVLNVVASEKMTEKQIRQKVDMIIGNGEEYKKKVFDKQPNQENKCFMGSVGLVGGLHYKKQLVIFNLRLSFDYMFGTFKSNDAYQASLARMGWGLKTGLGIDYKLTEKVDFGIEGGARFSQFQLPLKDKDSSRRSEWFTAPYMQANCTVRPDTRYGIGVFIGYFFPRQFSVEVSQTNLAIDTKCKFDGLFGGVRLTCFF